MDETTNHSEKGKLVNNVSNVHPTSPLSSLISLKKGDKNE